MKKISGKFMVPGNFMKKKAEPVWHMPYTRFLIGEQAIQGDQLWFMRVNAFYKLTHPFYSAPIPYSMIEKVELGEGAAQKNTLKIITSEVNGTYYLRLSEWAEPCIGKVKELLEACVEEGCYGAKAEAVARTLDEPMTKAYHSHLMVAAVCFVLSALIGWYFNVFVSFLVGLVSFLNARVTRIPAIKWIPVALSVIYFMITMSA